MQASLLNDDDAPDAAALAAAAALRGTAGHHDELHGRLQADGATAHMPFAPPWQAFMDHIGAAGWADLPARMQRVQRRVRDDGATYNVYAEGEGAPRAWPLELLPFIIDSAQWRDVERGVAQRARMLNAVLGDIYGAQRLLSDGTLPPSLVLAHPQYLRPMHGCIPPGGVYLHIAAFDLARGPDGHWWVVAQRTQAPSGLGYLLENRLIVAPQFPEAFAGLKVQRIAASFQTLLQGLLRISPAGSRSRVVLLTPGPYSETYFEQVFLARYLGVTLVEGGDLTVRNDRLYLKTLHGLERVHVVLRRLDDDYLDPLELRPDSALGVPGLLQALRAGQVVVANAPGAGVLESPGLAAFWPGVAQELLNEELLLPAMTSWWCGEPLVWSRLAPRLDEFVVAPTFPASASTKSFEAAVVAEMDARAREALVARIQADPAAHTLQARVLPSETPVWHEGALEPRPAVLRVFALADGAGGWRVLPGGMTRVATQRVAGHDPWLSMQHGSASADTWVQTEGTIDTLSLLPKPLAPADIAGWHRTVTSRAAENLFWLGRYTERAENSVRLARLALEAMPTAPAPVLGVLAELAQRHGLVPRGVPSPAQSARVFERALVHGLVDLQGATSVGYNLRALRGCATALRERLSQEHWKLIHEVGDHFEQHLAAVLGAASEPLQGVLPGIASVAPRDRGAAEPVTDVLGVLGRTATHLAAITGAQTDRMVRDDGWRLLSVGRQIERLDMLAHALALGFERGLHESDDGFALLLGLFDSTITYRAQFQARREVPPLLQLLVLDTDNPRALAWVARTMRDRFVKLSRPFAQWSADIAAHLPHLEDWSLEALCSTDDQGRHALLLDCLESWQVAALNLSDAISRQLFSHAVVADRMVWQ